MKIKGITDGILVRLSRSNWDADLSELRTRIEAREKFFKGARLALDVGDKVIRAAELGKLRDDLFENEVILWAVICKSQATKQSAQLLGLVTEIQNSSLFVTAKDPGLIIEGEPALLIIRTLLSGEVIKSTKHIVIYGNVNPGAEVISNESIIVWGKLRGAAHAGCEGDQEAIICALQLSPTFIRIADHYSTPGSRKSSGKPEIVLIENGKIVKENWKK
ncbi:MAG: hypothetical protein MUO40_11050 [Anaerolineaceae bacterium]|nr:hypothetical protein [Anaerolineaceae bacterium]